MFVFDTGQLTKPRYIINFPTKRHWRGKSRLEDIESGLQALVREVRQRSIRSIAIPPLGCGLGGLQWSQVRPRIEAALAALPDVHAIVFAPSPRTDTSEVVESTEVPRMTPGRAALVGLMNRYLTGLLDPFISLLEVHKLMYFMQEAGERLRLRYTKAPYGPYAENLRHVLTSIEGHLVSGYTDGGDDPEKQIELVPGAVADATHFLAEHPETHRRFDRVADLVQGFETPFGLELLSTVHWVAAREGAATEEEALERTYAWNERKSRFSPRQIRLAWDVLRTKGWLSSESGARPA
jgi:O-acetyl-ADP-ribose deacetylase (regulator of RNase III)